MSKFKCQLSISLDGYLAGPNQSLQNPLGEGAEGLHQWVMPTKTFRTMHSDATDGETGVNDDVLREFFANTGATIMGRNMFGPERGPWSADPWKGWWDEDPPFHHPVFVLTHHARAPLTMQGGTTFHFVTDGIESALAQARRAAGNKDVSLGGGAETVREYLSAGLLDELELHLVPIFLGSGERPLDHIDPKKVRLEPLHSLAGRGVTHLKYHVVKTAAQ